MYVYIFIMYVQKKMFKLFPYIREEDANIQPWQWVIPSNYKLESHCIILKGETIIIVSYSYKSEVG